MLEYWNDERLEYCKKITGKLLGSVCTHYSIIPLFHYSNRIYGTMY